MDLKRALFSFGQLSRQNVATTVIGIMLACIMIFILDTSKFSVLGCLCMIGLFGILYIDYTTFCFIYKRSLSRKLNFEKDGVKHTIEFGHYGLFRSPVCDNKKHIDYLDTELQRPGDPYAILFADNNIFIGDKNTSLKVMVEYLSTMTYEDGGIAIDNATFFHAKAGTINSYGRFFTLWTNPLVIPLVQEQ